MLSVSSFLYYCRLETSPYIKTWRLSELTAGIEYALTDVFGEQLFWVVADVTDHSFYPGKQHHYFTLAEKDPGSNAVIARMSAVAWRPGAARIRAFEEETGQRFGNNLQVLLQVSVDYHHLYGLKLVTHGIDASFTLGKLEQQRRETLLRLCRECSDFITPEGDRFRTRNNSLDHRPVIQRIAVVTSAASAGYEDFRHTLETNGFGYRFSIDEYFTPVQGEAHAEALSSRLEEIEDSGTDYDAVVIMRGGGAQTDFLIFDQYALCRQIARLSIPVITGIGHLRNESIADLMAHTATKTPTKAAEFIVAHNRGFEESLAALRSKIAFRVKDGLVLRHQALATYTQILVQGARAILDNQKTAQSALAQTLSGAGRQAVYRHQTGLLRLSGHLTAAASRLLSRQNGELAQAACRLPAAARNLLARQEDALEHAAALCRMADPAAILSRGYALVYYRGKIVTDAASLPPGSEITIRLSGTEIQAITTYKKETDGNNAHL